MRKAAVFVDVGLFETLDEVDVNTNLTCWSPNGAIVACLCFSDFECDVRLGKL